jgi:PII-like signaling protein
VDEEAKIEALIEALHPMLGSALVTLEAVRVVRYGHDAGLD